MGCIYHQLGLAFEFFDLLPVTVQVAGSTCFATAVADTA